MRPGAQRRKSGSAGRAKLGLRYSATGLPVGIYINRFYGHINSLPSFCSIPLLLLNNLPDDPVLDALLQFDVLIPGIERMQDKRIAEFLQLLEGGFLFIVLNDHVISISLYSTLCPRHGHNPNNVSK